MMSEVYLMIKGFLIGLAVAAPVGPIGVLCIQRSLTRGWTVGLLTGLGAATADAVYGCIAGLGLTFISNWLIDHLSLIRLFGGLYLCFLAYKIYTALPPDNATPSGSVGLGTAYATTFLLTLSNPVTIIFFVSLFTGFGVLDYGGGYNGAGFLVLGVFLGSAMWWIFLSGGTYLLRTRIGTPMILWINRISGVVVAGFGLYILFSIIKFKQMY